MPKVWISPENQKHSCWYPTGFAYQVIKYHIKNCSEPDEESWTKYPCEITSPESPYDTLDMRLKRMLDQATETEADEPVKPRKKATKKRLATPLHTTSIATRGTALSLQESTFVQSGGLICKSKQAGNRKFEGCFPSFIQQLS